MFYWALLNVKNHQKYSLTAIQLLAVCKVSILRKYKSHEILNDFVTNMNILSSTGLELIINGKEMTFHGINFYF